MVWNHTDKASLTMKKMTEEELKSYLVKISDEALYAYNVYQIEGEGRDLFSSIDGNENTIMGLPIEKIKKEVDMAKNTFKKYKWPFIDVTRKSVEETAASVIRIYEIYKENV